MHTHTHLNGRCELMSSKLEIEGVIVIRHLLREEELNARKKSLKIFFNFDLLAEKNFSFPPFSRQHTSTLSPPAGNKSTPFGAHL